MSERIGFRPRMESQRGFSQSRGKERIPFKETHYDPQEDEYISYVESLDDPDRISLEDRWDNLTSKGKALVATGVIAGLGLVGGVMYEGVHLFGRWQMRDSQPDKVINLNDPSIPGHDSVATTPTVPSVTVTSAPPGKEPLTITLPKK